MVRHGLEAVDANQCLYIYIHADVTGRGGERSMCCVLCNVA